jgi:Na+/melibiose symporter-like transporter
MSTTQAPAEEKSEVKGAGAKATIILLSMGGVVIFLITYFITREAPQPEPWETAALFSLPAVAMFIGLYFQATRSERRKDKETEDGVRHFHKFTMWICYICIVAYCVLWLLYSFGGKNLPDRLGRGFVHHRFHHMRYRLPDVCFPARN